MQKMREGEKIMENGEFDYFKTHTVNNNEISHDELVQIQNLLEFGFQHQTAYKIRMILAKMKSTDKVILEVKK